MVPNEELTPGSPLLLLLVCAAPPLPTVTVTFAPEVTA
jgi:hypothetical protein